MQYPSALHSTILSQHFFFLLLWKKFIQGFRFKITKTTFNHHKNYCNVQYQYSIAWDLDPSYRECLMLAFHEYSRCNPSQLGRCRGLQVHVPYLFWRRNARHFDFHEYHHLSQMWWNSQIVVGIQFLIHFSLHLNPQFSLLIAIMPRIYFFCIHILL